MRGSTTVWRYEDLPLNDTVGASYAAPSIVLDQSNKCTGCVHN